MDKYSLFNPAALPTSAEGYRVTQIISSRNYVLEVGIATGIGCRAAKGIRLGFSHPDGLPETFARYLTMLWNIGDFSSVANWVSDVAKWMSSRPAFEVIVVPSSACFSISVPLIFW